MISSSKETDKFAKTINILKLNRKELQNQRQRLFDDLIKKEKSLK